MDYQPVKRRSKNEKILCVLLVLAVIIAIVLAVFLVLSLKQEKKTTDSSCSTPDCLPKKGKKITDDLCTTPDCLQASATILRNMDSKLDPCDDFYQFACGQYLERTVIPPSRTLVDAFTSQSKVIDNQINIVLEEPVGEKDSKAIRLVKKVYEACMDEEHIEQHSMNTIKNLVWRLGGWPVVEGNRWNEGYFDWMETLLKLRDNGMAYDMFMDFPVELDNKNSSRRVLTVDQPYIPFESIKRGSRNNPMLDSTHKFMVSLAVEFGAERNLAEREMENVLNFEMDLAKIMVPPEDRRDLEKEYHPFSIRELERNYPILRWHQFVNRLITPSKMSYEDKIIVYLPNFLEKLQALMRKTPKRLLANYMFYKAVGSMISYATKKLRDIQFQFTKETLGLQTSVPRSEQCTRIASRLDIAAGALYVQRYFQKDAKIKTEEIVKNIEKQFMETLSKVDWMDQETKNAAMEKLSAMEKFIAYPDELMDNTKLEEYYKDLHLTSMNYIEVVLNLSKSQTERDMKQLSEPVIKSDWRTRSSVAIVNAFYDPNSNAIQVPAGILQGVFFEAKRPQYLNYGGIGYIIGHEFTHGFDDEGSQMDKDGNLREWWKDSTKAAYDEKAKCIVDQYSEFVVPEVNMTLNGVNTQGENIADNGGIKLAYHAYQDWVSQNKPEPMLPGLDFTPNQMFWIGTANVWCAKMKEKALAQELVSEVHPPERFRINVPFANSGLFAKDFNCPKGSNMNPRKTCTVW